MNTSAMLGATTCIGGLSLVAFLFGFIAPFWRWVRTGDWMDDLFYGLWENCFYLENGHNWCYTIVGNSDKLVWPDWLMVVQAMECLSLVSSIVAIICTIIWAFRGISKPVCITASVCYFLAFLFILIAVILYGVKASQEANPSLSWAYVMTVIACALYIIPGALAAAAAAKAKPHKSPK